MNEVLAPPPPYLTEAEIDGLCKPLTQRHAQKKRLCILLDVTELPQRPDGLPLVGRKMAESRLNATGDYQAPEGFNWSK